ncbi:MAG: 3-oxoacyl-ACP synthase [Paludibacteraceae bacterium]|nr:3-oxoacyl-ACP synthase [Paludibacteraceae bacterium]
MNYIVSDHIITPVAVGTEANLQAVIEGRTALTLHRRRFPLVEPFYASLFGEDDVELLPGFSRFESLCVAAVRGALRPELRDMVSSSDTLFILSSTKGNVGRLATGGDPLLPTSARKIASLFGNTNAPVTVCNACISGVSALITAQRLLEAGVYSNAVVVGCDVLSAFIVSGFQSFKALSDERCRPFDSDRKGLNLGEAAACVILSSDRQWKNSSLGTIISGSVHNDANHISGPSRTGEGAYLCLRDVADGGQDKFAFISLHGTATLYNDEMESIAVTRAGLQDVPVNSLKATFGHTLGAAGLLETVLSLHALRKGLVLPMNNYAAQGTTSPLNISTECRQTDKREFVKLLSGFGGCNAAVRISINPDAQPTAANIPRQVQTVAEVHVTPDGATCNGQPQPATEKGEKLLTELYRAYVRDYSKFFKMDTLSRLGFVATELLLRDQSVDSDPLHTAVLFANRSASLKSDTDYQRTIQNADNYYPSPALFVYTLPNIVTGEVAIRHLFRGESSFYVLEDEKALATLAGTAFTQPDVNSVICGWVECSAKDSFEAKLKLLRKI